MAMLHTTAAYVIPLLLCLCIPSTASQAIQHLHDGQRAGGEVRKSLEAETRLVQLNITSQETGTGDASITLRLDHNEEHNNNTKQNSKVNSINVKENATPETDDEIDDGMGDAKTAEDSKNDKDGRKKQTTQGGDTQRRGWFTDTLNVTIRPVVTWSRRTALQRPSPVQTEESKEEDKGEEEDILLTVKFVKEDQPLILDLHPTRDLLAASYRESSGDGREDDTLPGETKAMHCEYQGVVRGEDQAWVALSVCGGISGVVVVTLEGGKEVELLVEPSPGSITPQEPHRVYSSTLLNLPERTCGVKDADPRVEVEDNLGDSIIDAKIMKNASVSPHHRARRWAGLVGEALWYEKTTRFVELVLVADHSFYSKHGPQTGHRCKAIANIVNAVYRPLGVVVVLSHLEVWRDRDKIPVTSSYEQNLQEFKKYRRKMMEENPNYENDNTMLLTAVDFQGTTVGYAVVSGMCGVENSAGVVQDKQDHVGVVAYTVSHEMGHNFGMHHDEDIEKNKEKCHCSTSVCVMSSTSSSKFRPEASWSSCSRRIIEKNVDSESYHCLRNVPTRMYPRSSCGDGVVDDGEQCDCGPHEFCNNPCCDAATCKFAVNASCASGPCCDTKKCQIKLPGVRCREVVTECDLPEFCSGNSEFCPPDVTKADGTPCHKGQGYCYEARCNSHEGMCQTVWGPTATAAEDACYTKLNKRGGSNGNCGFKGHTKTTLLPCADGDQLCGSLHCLTEPEGRPQLNIAMNFGTITFAKYKCSYVVSSDRLHFKYWLVPNGAKCGDSKMCLNQKCVKIPEPFGDCRGGCSGHGVCNSRNHCHCDPGFAPPDCSKLGAGGSIDSNSVGRIRYKDPLWEALFILSLIALGAAIVLCCLWSHVRRWWEARGRTSTPPCCARCLDACCCALMSLITDRLCTRKRNEDVCKEAKEEWEQDKMICQVDLDLKDKESHTNSWGVANEKLVTEVVTMTPKTSSDFSRKIQFPSQHCVQQVKPTKIVDRPNYMPSISVDSGCISDVEDTTVEESFNSRVSMRSVASLFSKFGTRSSPSPKEKEGSPPKAFERQRSVPLHRMVVDPLVGSRPSRHGTPPPDHLKHEWRRSVSLDVQTTIKGRPGGSPPPPPPVTGKINNKSHQVCRPVACQKDARQQAIGQGVHTPGGSNPTPAPIRPAPTLPSMSPPALPSAPKKALLPPGKTHTSVTITTQSNNESATKSVNPVNATQTKGKFTAKRPLLPVAKGPERSPAPKLQKSFPESRKPRAAKDALPPCMTAGRVKDLTKKLEKQ